MKKVLYLLFAVTLSALPGVALPAPMVDPVTVNVPSGLATDTVVTEIKRAVIGRGWTIEKEEPGKIYATLFIRTHVAKVLIEHESSMITISYLDSENLKYKIKNGKPDIHKNYNSWVNYIMVDINKNLQLAAL